MDNGTFNVNMIDQNTLTEGDALFEAIELFHFAFRAFTALPDEILAERGLGRVHHRILYFVARTPGQRVNELLATLGVSKQALHGPLKQLLDSGLVEMAPDEHDRRARRLILTAEGDRLEQQLSETQRALLAQVFQHKGAAAEQGWRQVMMELAEPLRRKSRGQAENPTS